MSLAAKLPRIASALRGLVKHPSAILNPLDEKNRQDYVARVHGLPQGLPSVDLLELFPDFDEVVEPYSFLGGTSLPIDLALLKALARGYPECRYFEIGTWRGESVANVASVAASCTSLSLSAREMEELGFFRPGSGFEKTHRFFSEGITNIRYIEHNSRTFDFSQLRDRFDLIFVDGDHTYEGVRSDTANVFNLLRDERSAIVWHDYGFTPELVRWSVLAAILDGCPPERRGKLYHVSNTMCAIYTEQPLQGTFAPFPRVPDKVFSVSMRARRVDGGGGVRREEE
jgi:predicted O-methyltransferase YrrM